MDKINLNLNEVFEGVKPIPDFKIPRIENMMNVDEHQDEFPRRIIFNTPGDVQESYVRMGSLPEELRNLIHEIHKFDGSWYNLDRIIMFSQKIVEFSQREKKRLEEITELEGFMVGDEVEIIRDKLGIMCNKNLIGKRGKVIGFFQGNRVKVISDHFEGEIDLNPMCVMKVGE